jgi:hypothetical protein
MDTNIRADVPKTDRELLLDVHKDVQLLLKNNEVLCERIDGQDVRIKQLENWRWYLIGGITLATFLLVSFGRYLDLGGKV